MAKKKMSAPARDTLELKLDFLKEHFDEHMEAVSEKFDRMDGRFDKMDVKVDKLSDNSATNTAILDEHVKRSNLLEDKMEHDRKEIDQKIEPIEAHVRKLETIWELGGKALKLAGKLVVAGAALGGAGFGVERMIKIFLGE